MSNSTSTPWFPNIATDGMGGIPTTGATWLSRPSIAFPIRFATPITTHSLWKDLFAAYTVLAMFGWLEDDSTTTMDAPPPVVLIPMQPVSSHNYNSTVLLPDELTDWLQVLRARLWEPSSAWTCARRAVAGLGSTLVSGATHVMFRGVALYEMGVYARRNYVAFGEDKRLDANALGDSPELVLVDTQYDNNDRGDPTRPSSYLERLGKTTELQFSTKAISITSLRDVVQHTSRCTSGTTNMDRCQPTTHAAVWLLPAVHDYLLPLATMLPRHSVLVVLSETAHTDGEAQEEFLRSFTHIRVRFVQDDAPDQVQALLHKEVQLLTEKQRH